MRRILLKSAAPLVTVVLTACSGSGVRRPPTPAPTESTVATSSTEAETVTTNPETAPTTPSVSSTTKPQGPATSAPGLSVRATVAATFASARVIQFVAPVQGISEAALTTATRYRRSNGQPATLADVRSGSVIEVRGQRGTGAAILATEVVLIG